MRTAVAKRPGWGIKSLSYRRTAKMKGLPCGPRLLSFTNNKPRNQQAPRPLSSCRILNRAGPLHVNFKVNIPNSFPPLLNTLQCTLTFQGSLCWMSWDGALYVFARRTGGGNLIWVSAVAPALFRVSPRGAQAASRRSASSFLPHSG